MINPIKKPKVAKKKIDGKYLGARGPTNKSKLSGLSTQPLRDSPSAKTGGVMWVGTQRLGSRFIAASPPLISQRAARATRPAATAAAAAEDTNLLQQRWADLIPSQDLQGVTRGYKDGLQPESLADGKLAGETKSTSVENWN